MMTKPDGFYDLCVVGGGIGGLSLAALAQRQGLQTVLCESHTRLGGCAGYFDRGPYTFDCGATALMGLKSGEPIRDLLDRLELDFEGVRTPEYRILLGNDELVLTDSRTNWESQIRQLFSECASSAERFWRIQERIGSTMFSAASGLPRLPLKGLGDVIHNLKILGISGTLASVTSVLTVMDLLRLLGLHHNRKFISLVAMLLQDTAQAGPETVPLANAAACLQAYRFGLSRPKGGMKAFAEGLGEALTKWGGELRTATIVDSVTSQNRSKGYLIKTRRGHQIRARQVAFNLPVDLAANLIGQTAGLDRLDRRSRAQWSAFTCYAAVESSLFTGHKALFHHVLKDIEKPIHDGNNVLISLSHEGDTGYGPADVRCITMSTHVRPEDWHGLSPDAYQVRKQDYSDRMLSALRRAFPEVDQAIKHIEFASPRSFARYTRRTMGRVGGPPVSRRSANLMAVDPGVLGRGLWIVGDSVFPGQGTMAVVMCAMRVLERMTGKSWYSDAENANSITNRQEFSVNVTT
jgi:C-3',4' desaturase CrtD